MGMGRGWFYHPISVASDGSGLCFVLQSFLGRLQAIRIPDEKKHSENIQISVAGPGSAAPAAKEIAK